MEWFESIRDLLLSYGITDSLITMIVSIVGYILIYIRTGTKSLTKRLHLDNGSNIQANLQNYDVFYKGKLISFDDLTFKRKEV